MGNPLTLPLLGGAVILAAGAGLHLGESAIGLINPIHFQGPAIHPRERGAAIDEPLSTSPPPPAYADLYGWDEGHHARLEDCGDCEALAARDRHAGFAAEAGGFFLEEPLPSLRLPEELPPPRRGFIGNQFPDARTDRPGPREDRESFFGRRSPADPIGEEEVAQAREAALHLYARFAVVAPRPEERETPPPEPDIPDEAVPVLLSY